MPAAVYRAVLAATLGGLFWASDSSAQQPFTPSEPTGAYAPSRPVDLDSLSDEELLDLYIATYQESLRDQVLDDARLVERGRLLLQTGYTFSSDRDDLGFRTVEHTIPELLLRYRLLERLELRLAWAGVTFDKVTDELTGLSDRDTRFADPSAGVRLALSSGRNWFPRTSVTVSSPFDLESSTALMNRVDPLVGVGYSWVLGDRWLLSGHSAAVWTREDDRRYLDFQQSVNLDWMINDRWDLHVEWSGVFPEGARWEGMNHSAGPGVLYSLTRDLQLDLFVLFGLDDPSPDLVTQFVVTRRF